MTVLEVIKRRFSVRSYLEKKVKDDDLTAIIEAAQYSQSAKNLQDWLFIIVRDATMRRQLVDAAKGQHFVANAPVIIVCCGINPDYVMTCGQYSYSIDVAIAMENMVLVAYERGLGTCWLGSFYEDQVKNLLGIPEKDTRVVGMLTLGYPAVEAPAKKRQPLKKIVKYEKW